MLKIETWSKRRRIESLREMDIMLREMCSAGRGTIWQEYGGGKKATEEETLANWDRIASDDEAYLNAIFCYMVCTLEPFTLDGFFNMKIKFIRK